MHLVNFPGFVVAGPLTVGLLPRRGCLVPFFLCSTYLLIFIPLYSLN